MAKTRESISLALRFAILRRDRNACQYCGAKAPDTALHIDHVTPVFDGGTNDPSNLITACFRCNVGKGVQSAHTEEVRPLTERERVLSSRADWYDSRMHMDNWIFEVNVGASSKIRLVLAALGQSADPHGTFFVSVAKIARQSCITVRQTLLALLGLIRVGNIVGFEQGFDLVDGELHASGSLNWQRREDGEHIRHHTLGDFAWPDGFSGVERIH